MRRLALVILSGSLLTAVAPFATAEPTENPRSADKRPAKARQDERRSDRRTEIKESRKSSGPSREDDEQQARKRRADRDVESDDVAVTPGREAAALTFARLHHPELADLLAQLAKTNRPAYRKAVRELFQTSERLARLSEQRSPERYELALRAWKIDSRLRLLAARMTMSDDPALDAELKAALEERLDVRLEQLQFERARAAERLRQLDESIATIEQHRETALRKELDRVKRGLPERSKARPNPPKSERNEARKARRD